MRSLDVRLYDSFADAPHGGNVAGVVHAPPEIDAATMQRLAAELGAPAAGFVAELGGGAFGARFFRPRAGMRSSRPRRAGGRSGPSR